MLAIDVFSAGILYLKKKMFENCQDQISDIIEAEIQWVITVPAIWNDKAKAFMREAAIQVRNFFTDVHRDSQYVATVLQKIGFMPYIWLVIDPGKTLISCK